MIGRAHIARSLLEHPCLPQIEEALARGNGMHSMQDVLDSLLAGQTQLWTDTRALAITCVHTWPRGKSCALWLAGGDLEQILAFEPDIIEFAKSQGCTVLEVYGRSGWAKMLRERGYGERSVNLQKSI